MQKPVVIITVKDGDVVTFHADTPEPLIINYDAIIYGGAPDAPAEYLEAILPLPIDSCLRIHLVDSIFSALGYDAESCVESFNAAADNLNLPPMENLLDLSKWPGWLLIEGQRGVCGEYIQVTAGHMPCKSS